MASKKLPIKPTVAQAFKAAQSGEDTRKAARKTEGTSSKKVIDNQYNPNQKVTVMGKSLPSPAISRSPKMRPKKKNETELEWIVNTTKEDISKGIKAVKKKFGK
jgi:hypothetical protein